MAVSFNSSSVEEDNYFGGETQAFENIPDDKRSSLSIQGGNCTPPLGRDGIVKYSCCIGATTERRGQGFNPWDVKCALGSKAYERVRMAAMQELNHGSLQLFPAKTTITRNSNCDVCQIVDIAHQHNYTIAFTGDSVQTQIWHGFLCELARNGYDIHVVSTEDRKTPKWNRGVLHIDTVQITRRITHRDNDNNNNFVTVWARHYKQYRPLENDMKEIQEIAQWADILFFHFGIHWLTQEKGNYRSDMTFLLSELYNQNHSFALLAHRESSTQHFVLPGGEYQTGPFVAKRQCIPVLQNDTVLGWRERLFEEVAVLAGFQVETADSSLQTKYDRQRDDNNIPLAEQRNNVNENHHQQLFIVPFLNFTRDLYYMHRRKFANDFSDCTHFCAVPFLWMPLWRSLRIALEYQQNNTKKQLV